jgi:hypothetical protein
MRPEISVNKKPCGTFRIFNNDSLLHDDVPEKWLPKYLNAYLVEYKRDHVLRRLKTEDKAAVETFSLGKLEQV